MNRTMTDDLLGQFQRAISMVRSIIEKFEDEQWLSGISWFQTPARVGYHLVESLDFYFSGKRDGEEFTYGYRFDGPWWKMKAEELPKREALLEYLDEVQKRIEEAFRSLDDRNLSAPFELYDWSSNPQLGHYVYALRHTMHHQGALTVLAAHHGHDKDTWT
jgi:uncharacterized damage-inducible protein DinB